MKSKKVLHNMLCMLFFLFCGVLLTTNPAVALDVTVCASGCDYTQIQGAIDAVFDAGGGTVTVTDSAEYAEEITMKDGVHVESYEVVKPKIAGVSGGGGGSGKEAVVTFSGASGTVNCNLTGFDVSNAGGGGGGAGIFVDGSVNEVTATVENCEIHDNTGGGGIRLNGLVNPTIRNCNIYGNQRGGVVTRTAAEGDLLASGSSITILQNTIGGSSGSSNDFGGIVLNGTETPTDIQVTIGGNAPADSNTISFNIKGSGASDPGGVGIWLWRINTVHIENNEICNNEKSGIVLIDVTTGTIVNNKIHDHLEAAGINIGGASDLTIGPSNEIYSNYAGIAFYVELNPGPGFDNSVHMASSGTVTIGGNDWDSRNYIYSNAKAGIAVIDELSTGQIDIKFNEIHTNTNAGIAFFNECTAFIEDNEIHTHTGAAGMFTGDWSGTLPPDDLGFDTTSNPASLTIQRNKVHDNRAGMRLDHASGTITNNLVYGNSRSGIRFSGNSDSPYAPFTDVWGITDITNNTVAYNRSDSEDIGGGGIVYDDISATAGRSFFDPPQGTPPVSLDIRNNISANNEKVGIRAGCTEYTVYNLLYGNFGYTDCDATVMSVCVFQQLGGFCWPLPTGVIFADPLFVDKDNDNYQLQGGSPAIDAGDPGVAYNDTEFPPSQGDVRNDMGAYGGPDPITW